MKILVIGATGRIGKKLVARCRQQGLSVRAMARSVDKIQELMQLGAEIVPGDLESDTREAFAGCELVVFTAGSGSGTGGDKTLLVDLYGSMRAVDNAEQTGVRRFLMVSSLKADNPLYGPPKIRHYLVARNRADDYLSRSRLTYTILRPGRLLDTPGTGRVTSVYDKGDIGNEVSTISRDDVVEYMMACIQEPLPSGAVVDLIHGQTPIAEHIDEVRNRMRRA